MAEQVARDRDAGAHAGDGRFFARDEAIDIYLDRIEDPELFPAEETAVERSGGSGRRRNAVVRPGRTAGMSTTIATPDADETCAYCGSRIFDHDPICVRDCTDDCGSPSYFCNHACLSEHIDEEELTYGDACEWSPE